MASKARLCTWCIIYIFVPMNFLSAKSIVGVILLGLFLVPNVAPAVHALLEEHSHHDHLICESKGKEHFHQIEVDCTLCDYLIGIKPIYLEDDRQETTAIDAQRYTLKSPEILLPIVLLTPYLRGPPVA